MRTLAAAGVVAVLALSACGSTVQVRSTTAAGDAGLGVPGPDVTSAPGRGLGTTPTPGSARAGTRAGTAVAAAPQPGTSAPSPVGVGPSRRTGLSPVQVGFQVTKNNASTASSLGFKLDNGDEKHAVQALVAAANAAGGLAGHRIAPVWYELDPATTQSYDSIGQQVCSHFTEDTHVVAVGSTALFDTTNACLSSRGVPAFNGSTQLAYSEAELRRMPTVATFGITQRRQALAVVDAAARQGYLTSKPKVGVISMDSPAFHDAVDTVLLPRLRASGARVDNSDVAYGPVIGQTSDLSAVATAMQSAVLRFRRDGVTHVVFLSAYAASALVFMQQADSQRATFRYALSANDAPQVLIEQGVPARQLKGAVAAGWDPYLDVRVDKVGRPPGGRAWCTTAFAKLGLQRGSNAEWVAQMHCDVVQLLLAAGRRVPGELTSASLIAALGQVGTLASADTWSARITTDHRWAVAGYRLNRYDETCGCFAYLDRRVVAV